MKPDSKDAIPAPSSALEMTGDGDKTDQVDDDVCPEGGYGWYAESFRNSRKAPHAAWAEPTFWADRRVVVACIAAVNATTWGLNTTFGVYQSFLIQNNYFTGGSPLRYAFVGGLSVGTAFILAPIANYLSKRFTFRVPMLLGIICATLGQSLAGISTDYGMLAGLQGVVFGLGLGLTLVPCQPLLAHWFNKRLALAQGLSNAGSGVGGLIFSNTTRLAIETVGLKYSLVINGLISLVVLTPAVILMRGRVKQLKAKSEPLQVHYLWHPGFFWVWLQGMLAMMGFFITVFSLASYASDGLGLSQTQAAALQSILSAGQMIGRPLVGLGLDFAGRINTTIIIHVLSGLTCFAFWLPSRSFGLLVVFAISIGALGGTVWGATPPIAQSVIGTQHLASALGVYWVIVAAPACFANPIAIALLDRLQGDAPFRTPETYRASISLCGTFYILAGIAAIGAKRYVQGNWRIMQKA